MSLALTTIQMADASFGPDSEANTSFVSGMEGMEDMGDMEDASFDPVTENASFERDTEDASFERDTEDTSFEPDTEDTSFGLGMEDASFDAAHAPFPKNESNLPRVSVGFGSEAGVFERSLGIVQRISEFNGVQKLSRAEHLAIRFFLEEPNLRTNGKQYPPAYLNAWMKLCSFARLVDAQKGVSLSSHKPTVDVIALLQQFAVEFNVFFQPPHTLVSVLKNMSKNGVPEEFPNPKATYAITELYNLMK
jgi:hypothetical protein